mgnify:CR=1 FL=1
MKLFRSAATIGGLTGISRILGLIRDMLMAAFLGAGPVADAFFVAFKLPNFFRRLFAEGAFNAAFIPYFSRLYSESGLRQAVRNAEQIFAVLLCSLLVLVSVVEGGLPWFLYLIAPGFSETPERFQLALDLTRLTFPYILFISLAAFYTGMLNALGRFAAGAATPVLLNIFMIGATLIGAAGFFPTGYSLAWSILLAGIAQWVWLIIAARHAGLKLTFKKPGLSPAVRHVLKAMVPGALGAGVMQINLLVDTILASFLPVGAISYLFYADRFNQLPLGMIGIAMSTALLPLLSQHLQKNRLQEAQWVQNRAIEYALILTLPAALALMALAPLLFSVLFERKAFGVEQVQETSAVLAAFSTGLPAYVGVKIFSTSFFARYDTKTPVKIAVISMMANIAMNLIFMPLLAHVGIALATSLSSWINLLGLVFVLKRQKLLSADERLRRKIPRILVASCLMFGGLLVLRDSLPVAGLGFLMKFLVLGSIVAGGLTLYLVTAFFLKAITVNELKGLFRKSAS